LEPEHCSTIAGGGLIQASVGWEPGERAMAPLLFICPKTNQQAPTGIETDVQSLGAAWKTTLKVNCPHCSGVHEISVRETYINGAIAECW
jgi:hypothetical protein